MRYAIGDEVLFRPCGENNCRGWWTGTIVRQTSNGKRIEISFSWRRTMDPDEPKYYHVASVWRRSWSPFVKLVRRVPEKKSPEKQLSGDAVKELEALRDALGSDAETVNLLRSIREGLRT